MTTADATDWKDIPASHWQGGELDMNSEGSVLAAGDRAVRLARSIKPVARRRPLAQALRGADNGFVPPAEVNLRRIDRTVRSVLSLLAVFALASTPSRSERRCT